MNAQLVVDSSAICALFFEDETAPESEQLLEQLEAGGVWVPGLFLWEVANVLLMAERRQRISQAERAEALQLVESLGMQIDQAAPDGVLAYRIQPASQYGSTPYHRA